MRRNDQSTDLPGAHDAEIAGIDALEIPLEAHPSRAARLWAAAWPKLAAIAGALLIWQVIVWLELKPSYALPGPGSVFSQLWEDLLNGKIALAAGKTMWRIGLGYGLALIIGTLLGLLVSVSKPLRSAFGSLVTGLQTMPSIAWFPLAILLMGPREQAILFVVVLGAAPAIANGLISAIDQISPLLLNAGRVLGARGWSRYRHVVLPACFPSFIGGLKQGWAFAWRSLIAGELLVVLGQSLGARLTFARNVSDAVGMLGSMIVILFIGILVDAVFFARLERVVRTRWGLVATS